MAEKKFKVGDVVTLKGSVIRMTVEYVSEYGMSVKCVWFDHKGRLKRDEFRVDVLEEHRP